jgi:hypothetical protein
LAGAAGGLGQVFISPSFIFHRVKDFVGTIPSAGGTSA